MAMEFTNKNRGEPETSVGYPDPHAFRIDRIRKFLDLPDPHPDPLVTSTDPAPDL